MIYLQKNMLDPHMVDVFTKSGGSHQIINMWAILYFDFFYDIDRDLYEKLKTGEVVEVELREKYQEAVQRGVKVGKQGVRLGGEK